MTLQKQLHILENALQLFAARGYDAVGVSEIAQTAGITKPTLYHYFGSKRGVLEAIINEYGDRLCEVIRVAAVYWGDLSATLNGLTLAYFRFAKDHPVFYRMQLAVYFAPPDSEANRMIRRTNELQHRIIEDLFVQAVRHHGRMKGRQMALAATFLGSVNTYIGLALNGYLELDENIAAQAVHQFMFGIYS